MKEKVVLFAENDPTALAQGSEYLSDAGYRVYAVPSAAEATHVLHTQLIHLAVLDLRLSDDKDEKDMSGLVWAQETTRALPKIIYTKFPTVEIVRQALMIDVKGNPSVVDIVDKKHDGPVKLLESVNLAFQRHVRMNWGYDPDWRQLDQFGLLNTIDPRLDNGTLPARAEELQDLLRRLFYSADRLQVGQLLWRRGGRAAVTAFPFAAGHQLDSVVVVCGPAELMTAEATRFDNSSPHAPGDTGTARAAKAETVHYGASAYSLAGADLETAQALVKLYETAEKRTFDGAVEVLFKRTLTSWHQNHPKPSDRHLFDLYGELVGLVDGEWAQAQLESRATALAHHLPILRTHFERRGGQFVIKFDNQAFAYPDPLAGLARSSIYNGPVMVVRSPGVLNGDNILADQAGHAWLTDFGEAGQVPELWNYLTLEAAIRFDWVAQKELRWLHDFEVVLTGPQFTRWDTALLESPLRRASRAIRTVRQLAAPLVQTGGPGPYYAGLFFHAISRLAEFDPTSPLTDAQLARLAHVMIGAAVLASWLAAPSTIQPEAERGLLLDEGTRSVLVGGEARKLSPQAFDLLRYMHAHPSRLISRQELVREVFGVNNYNESEGNRLNQAIYRLRRSIEIDPEHPSYITSVDSDYIFNPMPATD